MSIVFIAYRLGHAHARRTSSPTPARSSIPPQPHPRDLPVDDRHPAAGRLRVGHRARRRGDQPGEGHQARRPAQPDHPGRRLLPASSTSPPTSPSARRRSPPRAPGRPKLTGYAAAGADAAPIGDDDPQHRRQDRSAHTGTTVSLIVAVTVLLALLGTTLACLNTGVRVTYAMAKDKEMPGILGLLHGKFATPHGGIWILTGVSAADRRLRRPRRSTSTTSPRSRWPRTPARSSSTG